jgi:tellurite resistance protein
MAASNPSLLDKVVKRLSEPPSFSSGGEVRSMLMQLASAYSAGVQEFGEESTQPTGFNPFAAALFEAVLESAFLVANADGHFDDEEHAAFVRVVIEASGRNVSPAQIDALLADLSEALEEDGLGKRIDMVAKTIQRKEHALEVLRIAALLAYVSEGVSEVERRALSELAGAFGLESGVVGRVLSEVERAVDG